MGSRCGVRQKSFAEKIVSLLVQFEANQGGFITRNNRRTEGSEIAKLPLVADSDGAVLTVMILAVFETNSQTLPH